MVKILREADKAPVADIAKKLGVSNVTIYTWRKSFGQLDALRHAARVPGRRPQVLSEVGFSKSEWPIKARVTCDSGSFASKIQTRSKPRRPAASGLRKRTTNKNNHPSSGVTLGVTRRDQTCFAAQMQLVFAECG